jgi:hypothetical protein
MATLRAGIILGILVVLWTFVMGFTGWYHHPTLFALRWLAIPTEVGVLLVLLRITASRNNYFGQLMNGVAASVIAGAVIFLGSLLFTTLAFPSYFREMEALGRLKMAHQGMPLDQIEEVVRAQAPFRRPLPEAFLNMAITWFTGLLTSLIAATWLRRK